MDAKKLENHDWQIKCSDLRERGSHLVNTGVLADCEFLVDGEKIPAHKLILAMASPVFEAMFYGSMPQGDGPVILSDVSSSVFKSLLQWIYTDKHNQLLFDETCELYYVAKKYMLNSLVKKTLSVIRSLISLQNLNHAYEIAKLFEEDELVSICLKKIQNHTSKILSDPIFVTVNLEWLMTVFTQTTMTIASELELFNALERYYTANAMVKVAEEKCEGNGEECDRSEGRCDENVKKEVKVDGGDIKVVEKSIDTKTDKQVIDEDLIIKLRPALHQIRFLRLTAAQMAEGPCGSPLLSDREAFFLLVRVANPASSEPLPQGFCKLREERDQPDYMKRKMENASNGAWSESRIVYSVSNFKTRKMAVYSSRFYIGKVGWSLKFQPQGEGIAKKLVVYICAHSGGAAAGWCCPADVAFTLRSHSATQPNLFTCRQFEFRYGMDECFITSVSWEEACSVYSRSNTVTADASICVHPDAKGIF